MCRQNAATQAIIRAREVTDGSSHVSARYARTEEVIFIDGRERGVRESAGSVVESWLGMGMDNRIGSSSKD
jgi:hypothetical protein